MKKLKNLTTIVFQPNRLVTKWKFLSFSKLYLSPLPLLFQIFSCSFLACHFPAADDCDIDGIVRNIKLLLLLVCSLLTAGHQFLVANSHSSNSCSWSLCLSVGWSVPSCDSSFGTLTKLSDTFTFKPLVHFVPTVL